MSKLKERTLVTLKEEAAVDYPFSDDLPLVYLGELANMPEHGIFIGNRANVILDIIFGISES